MAKRKLAKGQQQKHEQMENRNFLLVVLIATIVLMGLMYILFVG